VWQVDKRKDGADSGDLSRQRLDEKQLSAVVRGVFWFAWLTARYRRAAHLAGKVEGQNAELN
jgi:hypothetical protein